MPNITFGDPKILITDHKYRTNPQSKTSVNLSAKRSLTDPGKAETRLHHL